MAAKTTNTPRVSKVPKLLENVPFLLKYFLYEIRAGDLDNCGELPNSSLQLKKGGGEKREGKSRAAEKRRKGEEGLSKCPSATVTITQLKKKNARPIFLGWGGPQAETKNYLTS